MIQKIIYGSLAVLFISIFLSWYSNGSHLNEFREDIEKDEELLSERKDKIEPLMKEKEKKANELKNEDKRIHSKIKSILGSSYRYSRRKIITSFNRSSYNPFSEAEKELFKKHSEVLKIIKKRNFGYSYYYNVSPSYILRKNDILTLEEAEEIISLDKKSEENIPEKLRDILSSFSEKAISISKEYKSQFQLDIKQIGNLKKLLWIDASDGDEANALALFASILNTMNYSRNRGMGHFKIPEMLRNVKGIDKLRNDFKNLQSSSTHIGPSQIKDLKAISEMDLYKSISGIDTTMGIICLILAIGTVVLLFNPKYKKYALFPVGIVALLVLFALFFSQKIIPYNISDLSFFEKLGFLDFGIILSLISSLVATYFIYLTDKTALAEVTPALAQGIDSAQEKLAQVSSSKTKSCPECGAQIKGEAKFCPGCGADINKVKLCEGCGKESKPGGKFCPHCGEAVSLS